MSTDLALIDLSGLYWQAWHASGDPLSAARVAEERVRDLAEKHASAIVCTDEGRCFRYEISEAYKANRDPKPEEAVTALTRCKASLARAYHMAGAPGFEADDVIATLAELAESAGADVVIYSADKDLLQCVTERVACVSPKTGVECRAPEDVRGRLGVLPAQVPLWLAIMGDAADNVPGVPGLGAKAAASAAGHHGDAEALLKALVEADAGAIAGLTERQSGLLREHWSMVTLGLRLTELRRDVPGMGDVLLSALTGSVATVATVAEEESETMIETAEDRALEAQGPRDDDPRDVVATEPEQRRTLAVAQPSAPLAEVPQERPTAWNLEQGPSTSAQAWGLAKAVHASGMFRAFAKPEAAFVAIVAGHDIGLSPMQALRGMHVIEGKPTISADAMMAIILGSGKAVFFRCVESTASGAAYETHRRGDPDPVRHSFTTEDAKAAGLYGKDMWKKYPRNMLRARCISELARMVYPDLLMGVYTPEELSHE